MSHLRYRLCRARVTGLVRDAENLSRRGAARLDTPAFLVARSQVDSRVCVTGLMRDKEELGRRGEVLLDIRAFSCSTLVNSESHVR